MNFPGSRRKNAWALAIIACGWLTVSLPAETLAEKNLMEIAQRQRDILARAAKEGDHVDEAWLRGELQGVIKSYDVLIQKNPTFALAYGGYGMLLSKVSMHKEAVAMLLKANQLDPNLSEVKNQIAVLLAEDGRPAEALPWVTEAIALDPQKSLYHFQLGQLLADGRSDFLKTGQFTDAKLDQTILDAFRRAAELAPQDFAVNYRYGKAYYDLITPRWAEALAAWEKIEPVATSDTQRQLVHLQRAHVLLKLARPAEARPLIDSATSPHLAVEKQTLLDEWAKVGAK